MYVCWLLLLLLLLLLCCCAGRDILVWYSSYSPILFSSDSESIWRDNRLGPVLYYSCTYHTELIQAISALNLLLNLFLNSGAESMVQQE
jgi:hypothetical protein